MGCLLGFDMGTSGLKCVLYNPSTGKVISLYSEWKLRMPEKGYVEIDCDEIWENVIKCIKRLKTEYGVDGSEISSIGSCALCPGLIAVDSEGKNMTNSIIFMDARSGKEASFINDTLGEDYCYGITANRIMAGAASITTILWVKNNFPEVYKKTKYFVHLPTWLGYRLTGEIKMDYSNAAGTGLYNIHKTEWSEEMAEKTGVDLKKLPPLAQGVDLLGGLINEEFIALGIKPGTPVAVGAGDTVSTALALGITSHGKAFLSMGTSGVLTCISEKDSFDKRLTARSYIFKNAWMIAGTMSNVGGALKWFINNFCEDLKKEERITGKSAFETIDEMASKITPGSDGVLFLPYLNGERSPVFDSKVRGAFIGAELSTTRAHFARAVLESAAYGIRELIEIQEKLLSVKFDGITVVGGGTKSSFWMQLFADILNRKIYISDIMDSGAAGAAMLGGIAGGLIEKDHKLKSGSEKCYIPNFSVYDKYSSQYERYIKIYPAIKDLF